MLFGCIWGFIQAIILLVTRPDGILPNKAIYHSLNPIVNALRSLPFIILLIAVLPLTKLIVGTSIGTWAAIVRSPFMLDLTLVVWWKLHYLK